MDEKLVEWLFITIGPLVNLSSMMLNMINAYIFNTKNFKKDITYRLLFINSINTCILLIIGTMIPFSQCKILCNVSPTSLLTLIYEYYFCLCMGVLLECFGSGISLLLSIYRYISITIVKTKFDFNVNLHILIVFILSIMATFPWFNFKRIAYEPNLNLSLLKNKTISYSIKMSNCGNQNYFLIFLSIGPITSVLILIVELVLDIYILVHLRALVSKRANICKVTRQEAKRLVDLKTKESSKSLTEQKETQSINYTGRNKETIQELNLSSMLLSLSILSLSDHVVKLFPFVLFYNYHEDMAHFKFAVFIVYVLIGLNLLPNTFIYYYFSNRFRQKLDELNCIKNNNNIL